MNRLLLLLTLLTFSPAETTTVSTRFYSIDAKALEESCNENTTLLIPRYRGFNLYEIPVNCNTVLSPMKTDPEGFGIDLLFEPLLWFQFGKFDDPIESAVGVIPRVRFYLWRGGMFDVRSYFTFRDELNSTAGYQGGTAVLSQVVQPVKGQWFTGSAGWFTSDRWGFDLQWNGLFLDNHILAEIQTGVTGGIDFRDTTFLYTKMDRVTGVARVGYRVHGLNLLIQGEGGRYINKDWGGGGTLLRRFGIVDIALTGLYSSLGINGGFSITVPLWFGRHPQINRFRVGLGDSYRFRYRFKGYNPPAHMYETGVDLKQKLWEFHPDYIGGK